MIIDLPNTTTNDVNKRLVKLRDEGGAVALGRVLTLVIDVGDARRRGGHRGRERRQPRAPVPRHRHRAADDGGTERELDAQIRLGGDAGASEVIVLRPSGAAASPHGDTLVMPLLLPDAPIVAWWPYEPPEDPAQHPLGRMAQRRITDSTSCARPAAVLRRLAGVHQPGDTDLAWTRITLWRGLLAAALDQPPYEPVTKVVVVRARRTHPSVDLLAAWLARRPASARSRSSGSTTRARSPACASSARSGDIVLDRPDGKTAALRQPEQPEHRIALPIRQLRECLAEELRRLDPDEVYARDAGRRACARVAA